jgi:transcriptional regulator with XRE-family HTH domain
MAEMNKVGTRLSLLRNERGLTPGQLAERSGVPQGEIEAIESGRLSPSVSPLVKLSRALGVRVGTFLDDAEEIGPVITRGGTASEVMRAPGRDSPKSGAMSFYSIARGKSGRSMEPFIIEVRPVAGDAAFSTHEGEELVYVLEGEIELRYGEERYRLKQGDSVYYDSVVPHRVSSSAPARLLAVVYAPF